MPTIVLGKDAKIYQGAAGGELDALVEMSNVKDVTVTMEAGKADITTRGNKGWRATAPTLRECTCEFEMIWDPSDPCFGAIKTAFLTSSTVRLAALTAAKDVAGASGPFGDFSITKFSRNEPLEEAVTVSVTADIAKFEEWVEVAGT